GRAAPQPVHADHRGGGGGLLDGHDDVAGQDVEGRRLAGGRGQALAHRASHVAKVELAGHHTGELRQATAEPVAGGALVALHQRVAFQRAQQPERRRAVDVELAGDVGAGAPTALGEQVEDGHRPLYRADREIPRLVAHSATLALPARVRRRKLLSSEHLLGDAQHMSREEEIRAGLFEHTLNGHAPEVKVLTEEALSLGMDPMDILFKALIPSLEEVGRRFEKGDFFVPEMLIAARAMQGALVTLEYAKHVGADSYAPDASMATRMAKQLVGDRRDSSPGAHALEQAVMKIDETLRKG